MKRRVEIQIAAEVLEGRRHFADVFATLGRTGTLTLLGTPGDDHYEITSSGANVPVGERVVTVDRNGDILEFPLNNVSRITFDGGDGDDFVAIDPQANSFKNTLRGGNGRDTLVGGQYYDLIFGGPGADLLKGGNQRDTIYGEGGNDRIFGNAFNDELFGGAGNDKINGGPGNDSINAGRGDDTVASGGGSDSLFGGAGIDTALDLAGLSAVTDGIENL